MRLTLSKLLLFGGNIEFVTWERLVCLTQSILIFGKHIKLLVVIEDFHVLTNEKEELNNISF